jgi:hypothetical protein
MSKRSGADFATESLPESSETAPAIKRKKLRRSVRMGPPELHIEQLAG